MARLWTIAFDPESVQLPATNFAALTQVPTTLRWANAFDAATDEAALLTGVVPAEYTGAGTLRLRLRYCANTTSATLDVRADVATEFRTPGAGEAANVADLDATPDSATLLFSTTAYSEHAVVIDLTPATTPAAGDSFRIQVSRDADNAGGLDDLAVDCLVLGYEFYEET
jgi:hypothetical protein